MTFFRLFTIGCLGLATYSTAQTRSPAEKLPSHSTIETWLQSDDPRLVAWAAHDALLSHDRQLISQMLTIAGQWQPLTPQDANEKIRPLSQELKDKRDAMAAVVDGLIQMDVVVPADPLRALAPDFGNEVAILLARMPADDAQPLALGFYQSPAGHGYGLQYVSAALLAQRPPEGFAVDLLKSIRVVADVFVLDPGAGGVGRGVAGDCFRQPTEFRRDWPSTGQYRISKQKDDGAVMVVGGVNPVYATRELSTTYLDEDCPSPYLGPNERQRLIAEMLDIAPESMPWRTELTMEIEFVSSEQFDFELHRFIDEQQEKYRQTAAALAARGMMNLAEVDEALPRLTLAISDMRGSDATNNPIKGIPDIPPNVEFSNSAWK